jgi:transcription antitermination factor NusG
MGLEIKSSTAEASSYGMNANWFAVYTFPRHEKVAADQLEQKGIEVFLPMFAITRQWKDRRVRIHQPMFPGYLFTHINVQDRGRVLNTPSVLRIVSSNGMPSAIPDSEIEDVQRCLAGGYAEPHPFIGVGERVRVNSGAFEGIEGIGVRRTNHYTLIISIQLIHQSLALEIPFDQLEKVSYPIGPSPQATSSNRVIALQ